MNITASFLTKFRKRFTHFIVGVFVLNILYDMYSSPYANQWKFYTAITIFLAYYIHTLGILPFLTLKKQRKKYIALTIIGFFISMYTVMWFEAMKASEIVRYVNGDPYPIATKLPPTHFFFKPEWIFGSLLVCSLIFIPFFLLSFVYHLLIIKKKDRKRLLSFKYTEAIANVVISVSLLFFVLFSSASSKGAFHNSQVFVLFLMAFYLNTFLFTKKFLQDQKVLKYILLNALSFTVIILGVQLITNLSFEKLLPGSENFILISVIYFIVFALSFVYAYVRSKLKANERLFDLKLTAKESEIQLLKSQVNPHFLFNTLNTLYATSLKEEAPKTAQSIAKLGSLIRYMQNDINKEFIPLQKEVDYLKDYMEIQKLRLAIEPEIITTFENIDTQMTSPGLFIPLVENAFKYGIHPTEKSTIRIQIQCSDQRVYFECKNNYDPNQKVHGMNEGFGIGIQNVEKRLKLVYPEKHTFDIDKSATRFVVKLTLDLT